MTAPHPPNTTKMATWLGARDEEENATRTRRLTGYTKQVKGKLRQRLEGRLRKRKARPPVYVPRNFERKVRKLTEEEEDDRLSDTGEQRLRLVDVSVLQKLKLFLYVCGGGDGNT